METTDTKSIWDKTADELTVAESLKISTGAIVIVAAAPFVVLGAIGAAGAAVRKIKTLRVERKSKKNTESE